MYATVKGVRLAYSDRGQKHQKALLLVHGFPLDRHLWDSQLAQLSHRVRVVAPDLRGAGQSDVPPGPYSMEQHADDLAGLLDHLDIRCATVAGLSMGGYVAFALWRRHPTRVCSLALLNSRAEPDTPEGRANRDTTIARIESGDVDTFASEQLQALLAPGSLQHANITTRAYNHDGRSARSWYRRHLARSARPSRQPAHLAHNHRSNTGPGRCPGSAEYTPQLQRPWWRRCPTPDSSQFRTRAI